MMSIIMSLPISTCSRVRDLEEPRRFQYAGPVTLFGSHDDWDGWISSGFYVPFNSI